MFDGTWLVLGYVTLLVLVPSNRVLGAIGRAGTPAMIVAGGMLVLWGFLRLSGALRTGGYRSPIHFALAFFSIAIVGSYTMAMNGPLWPRELSAADRGLLGLASWGGAFLLTADTLPTMAAVDRILRWLTRLIAVEAVVALSQFFLRKDLLASIPIPGLTQNAIVEVSERSAFVRVYGTAIHSIEYGVIAAVGLALALHFALFAADRRSRAGWWSVVALIGATLPLTVARSATIGALVAILTLFVTWPRAWKRRAILAAPFCIVALRLLFPGVLGTIWSMFAWFREDTSAGARLTDYGKIWDLISGNPLLGRGVGTFLPELYFILDNEYLMELVTAGIVGLIALIILMGSGIGTAVTVRRRITGEAERHLVQSLLAGVLVIAVTWLFFDGFSFAQATGLFWFLLGILACLHRLTSPQELGPILAPGRWARFRMAAIRASVPIVIAVCLLGLVVPRVGKTGQFVAQDVGLVRLWYSGVGFYPDPYDVHPSVALLTSWLNGLEGRGRVRSLGGTATYVAAQGNGSLARPTERLGSGGIVHVRISASSAEEASRTEEVVRQVLAEQLETMQVQAGTPQDTMLGITEFAELGPPVWEGGSRKRALAGSLLLAGLAASLGAGVVRAVSSSWRRRRSVDQVSLDQSEK